MKNFDVKVHTSDRNVSAIMVVQANSGKEARDAAVTRVKKDYPHVTIREVCRAVCDHAGATIMSAAPVGRSV